MTVFHLAKHGQFIGSRFAGKEVRQQIEHMLRNGQSVLVDFGGVHSVSDSFIDELLGMLIVRQGPEVLRSVTFSHCPRDIEDAIRFAAEDALSQGASLTFR